MNEARILPELRRSLRGRPFELGAVVFTGIGKFVFGDLIDADLIYVVTACLLWALYIVLRFRWNPHVLDRWGFSFSRFRESGLATAPFALLGIGFCVAYALIAGSAVVNWNLATALILYPIWGLIQQFLVVALLADNIRAMTRVGEFGASAVAALLFALVHIPSMPLVIATALLGGVTTSIFFRYRCLWTAAILHGWFASLFYFLVLGEDPVRALVGVPLGL